MLCVSFSCNKMLPESHLQLTLCLICIFLAYYVWRHSEVEWNCQQTVFHVEDQQGPLEGFNFSLSVRKSDYCIQLQAVLIELKVWFNLVQMVNYSSTYPWTTCTHKVLYFKMLLKVSSRYVTSKDSFSISGPLIKFQST